jgi:hypothetical protein
MTARSNPCVSVLGESFDGERCGACVTWLSAMAATRLIRPVANERLLKDAAVRRMRAAWVAAVMRENDLKRLRLNGGLRRGKGDRLSLARQINRLCKLRLAMASPVMRGFFSPAGTIA